MQRPPLIRIGAALVVVLALAGCDGGGVANTPVPSISPILPTSSGTASLPSPSATASPSASPSVITARPTTSAETEALAAEAEQVYIAYKRLRLKYEAQGGVDGPLPQDLKQYVAGDVRSWLEKVLQDVHASGVKLENTDAAQFKRISTFTDNLEPGALIGLQFCDDLTEVISVAPDGTRTKAPARMQWSEFARGPEGNLQVVYNELKDVDSCAT